MKWDEMSLRYRDALVAENVMEWTRCKVFNSWAWGARPECDTIDPDIHVPDYTTDISAAWEVVQKLRSDGWDLELRLVGVEASTTGNIAFVTFFRDRGLTPVCSAETAPEAICLAALRAVGVEV